MKNAIRLALAGTAMLGSALAHGQAAPAPSTGVSDLWLFVTDPSKNETYARDTGVLITSLAPSTFTPAASLVSSPVTIDIAPDSTLTSFLTSTAGDTLFWGVQGDNQMGTKPAKPGNNDIVQANNLPAANTGNITFGAFTSINSGMNADEAYMGSGGVNKGSSFVFSLASGSPGANAWGTGPGGQGGSVDLYSFGANGEIPTSGTGSVAGLYLLTGDSSTTGIESYVLSTTLSFGSDGTLSTGGAPVPLPAAVWLFGSGLLGLAGVGRRRASAAPAA
jgi:hypothetical protein